MQRVRGGRLFWEGKHFTFTVTEQCLTARGERRLSVQSIKPSPPRRTRPSRRAGGKLSLFDRTFIQTVETRPALTQGAQWSNEPTIDVWSVISLGFSSVWFPGFTEVGVMRKASLSNDPAQLPLPAASTASTHPEEEFLVPSHYPANQRTQRPLRLTTVKPTNFIMYELLFLLLVSSLSLGFFLIQILRWPQQVTHNQSKWVSPGMHQHTLWKGLQYLHHLTSLNNNNDTLHRRLVTHPLFQNSLWENDSTQELSLFTKQIDQSR